MNRWWTDWFVRLNICSRARFERVDRSAIEIIDESLVRYLARIRRVLRSPLGYVTLRAGQKTRTGQDGRNIGIGGDSRRRTRRHFYFVELGLSAFDFSDDRTPMLTANRSHQICQRTTEIHDGRDEGRQANARRHRNHQIENEAHIIRATKRA